MKPLSLPTFFWVLFALTTLSIFSCGSSKSYEVIEETGVEYDSLHSMKEVVIFVYHRFGDNRYPSTNISTESFRQHLKYLRDHKFHVITLGEAVDYLQNPEIDYEERVAVITVDDGYKTFKSGAMPLLKEFGCRATLFINSESVGGGTYLDWDELKSLSDQGIEIGNHSHSHAYFVDTPGNERLERFKEDVLVCQEEIKKHIGITPNVLAYPYGEFDLKMRESLKEMGFKGAAAQNSGVMCVGKNIYSMPRFPMAGPFVKMEGFIEKANMKPLRTISENPESFILEQNPPNLVLEIKRDEDLDISGMQCFVQGGTCKKQVTENKETIRIEIRAEKPLQARRTLYTLTVPSRKGDKWHWYSHLWIRPGIKE